MIMHDGASDLVASTLIRMTGYVPADTAASICAFWKSTEALPEVTTSGETYTFSGMSGVIFRYLQFAL